MDDPSFSFMIVGAGRAGLRLRALRPFGTGTIRAWCRGIAVGQFVLPGPVAADTLLDLPITRLPCVPLPARLRLATAPDGPELAEPWSIASPGEAIALLGPPAPVLEDLRLEFGMLRGTGIERANGLLAPALHAVVNGTIARLVQAEAPVALAEGGCAFRFALALEPADLTGSGLGVTLHMPGLAAPLARFAWGPALPGAERLAELEARLLRLEQAGESMQASSQAQLEQRLARQQDRIDAFIDAAASLLLDRLTLAEPAAEALRGLIAAASPATPPAAVFSPATEAPQAMLAPHDSGFDLGWHAAEEDAGGGFRWMTLQGLVRNPAPLRPVAGVTITVAHLYGAPAPAIEASFDAAPCLVEAQPEGPHQFRLRIIPPSGPAPCRMLRLQSLAGGSPAEDGVSGDTRQLSVAVAGLAFDYEAGFDDVTEPGPGPR
ncbi:MAG: hypothetical protein JWP04_1431 [Belnapia sp.]|nr:hypothetical protein [Belnapia sp.]